MVLNVDQLIRANRGIIVNQAASLAKFTGARFDDLYSAGLVGLWQAIKAYKTGKGTTLGQFCSKRVAGAMYDWLRVFGSQKRDGRKREEFLPIPELEPARVQDPSDGVAREWIREGLSAGLSPRNWRILWLRCAEEHTACHTGQIMGVSTSRVDQIVAECAEHIRQKESKNGQRNQGIPARYAA